MFCQKSRISTSSKLLISRTIASQWVCHRLLVECHLKLSFDLTHLQKKLWHLIYDSMYLGCKHKIFIIAAAQDKIMSVLSCVTLIKMSMKIIFSKLASHFKSFSTTLFSRYLDEFEWEINFQLKFSQLLTSKFATVAQCQMFD